MRETIGERIEQVKRRIAAAARRAGRDAGDVELVAVTKTVPVSRIKEAVETGLMAFGENRVQEASDKIALLRSFPVRWHLIGHLQTNKSKLAVELFDLIHSLDSVKLAASLDRHGTSLGKRVRALIEVNLGDEPGKSGLLEPELLPLLQACRGLEYLNVQGVMAIPPFRSDPQDIRPYFRRLRELRDRAASAYPSFDLRHLSIGMSHDFEVAIEEGATIVRIGTAIFGERPVG